MKQASQLAKLTMFPSNVRLVVAGRKTTTLRGKVYPDGRYIMFIGGKPYAEVDVHCEGPISYADLDEAGKGKLARQEGFANRGDFERELYGMKLYNNYWLRPFLDGSKSMYLHRLSNPTKLEATDAA